MAAVDVQHSIPTPLPKLYASRDQADIVENTARFEPSKHLSYAPPSEIIGMQDIGYSEDAGVSPVAVSQPFPLFSKDAVKQMRTEIFNPEVAKNCSFSSNIASNQLRGYASKYAPFTYDAWTNPETLAIISRIAGVDLVPQMNYEIGHINFSSKTEEQTRKELETIARQKTFFAADEGIAGCPWEDDKPIVGWHTDSYPFVCVLMLSDCTNMVGGETALRTAEGNVIKVRGPKMGCAVVLQGRYITHQALRAIGAQERITSVTSFRPRSSFVRDDTVLSTVRPISDLSELYYDFGEYRLEILQDRIQAALKKMRSNRRAAKKFRTADFKKFLQDQEDFVRHTNKETVLDKEVPFGFIEEVNFDASTATSTKESPKKRLRPL